MQSRFQKQLPIRSPTSKASSPVLVWAFIWNPLLAYYWENDYGSQCLLSQSFVNSIVFTPAGWTTVVGVGVRTFSVTPEHSAPFLHLSAAYHPKPLAPELNLLTSPDPRPISKTNCLTKPGSDKVPFPVLYSWHLNTEETLTQSVESMGFCLQ